MVRLGSADLWTSSLGVKRFQRSVAPFVPRPSEAKEGCKLPKFKNLPPITHGSKMGPVTTDFDETRWDLIPPISFVIPLFNRSAHSAGPMLLVCLVVWWFGRLVSSSWKGRGRAEDGRTFLNPVALPRRSATAFQQLGRTSQRKP